MSEFLGLAIFSFLLLSCDAIDLAHPNPVSDPLSRIREICAIRGELSSGSRVSCLSSSGSDVLLVGRRLRPF